MIEAKQTENRTREEMVNFLKTQVRGAIKRDFNNAFEIDFEEKEPAASEGSEIFVYAGMREHGRTITSSFAIEMKKEIIGLDISNEDLDAKKMQSDLLEMCDLVGNVKIVDAPVLLKIYQLYKFKAII